MRRLIPAAAIVLLTAACSSGAPQAAPGSASPTPTASPSPAPSAVATSAAPTTPPSASSQPTTTTGATIVRSTQARHLPPGPFKITPVKCGPYTPAEKSQFGTTAKGGLVFKYTNMSNSLTDAVKLDVGFASGSTVGGENVNGNGPQVAPGQSAEATVDALNPGGGNLTFTSCELMTYSLMGSPAAGSYGP